MAIDTAEKRRSISGIVLPLIPGVTPNSAQDIEWRQEAGWSYSGIVAGVIIIGGLIHRFRRRVTFTDIPVGVAIEDNIAQFEEEPEDVAFRKQYEKVEFE